jgi:hypothetical protein
MPEFSMPEINIIIRLMAAMLKQFHIRFIPVRQKGCLSYLTAENLLAADEFSLAGFYRMIRFEEAD